MAKLLFCPLVFSTYTEFSINSILKIIFLSLKIFSIFNIVNTIIKSCYIPFLIDGNVLYKNKYVDGINPHVFKEQNKRPILHLDLFGYDKVKYLINIKNEKTNFHRILSGLLDIHNFYIKQTDTDMCSYINKRSLTNKFHYLLI